MGETEQAGSAGRRHWSSLLARLAGMPLRSRLTLAFALLIVSSASATIWIGDRVFGDKVDELARDQVTLHGRLAMQVFEGKLRGLRLLARDLGARYGAGAEAAALGRLAAKEAALDFMVLGGAQGEAVLLRFARGQGDPSFSAEPLGPGDPPGRGALSALLAQAVRDGTPLSGIAAVPAGEIAPLAGGGAGEEAMLLLAAAPGEKASGGVILGMVLNGRTEILEEARGLIPNRSGERLVVMLCLGDRVVAAAGGMKASGARADAAVTEAVLGRGVPFAGTARLLAESMYAAYLPLPDPSGRVVGMLGVGTAADAVAEVRRRTTAQFSTLIAAGMIFGFIMVLLFSAWLVHPIAQLAEGMSRVAQGDLDYKVRIESADELGRLAGAFNRMVHAVKERDHRLREMTESRLSQVEKQVSIGRLAAGVAHEINNPLTAILSLSSLWLAKMPADDPRREGLEIVVTETSRCREIVRSLLDFARERPIDRRRMDVNAVAREALLLADKYDSMAGVKLEAGLAAAPLWVNADAKLIEQVLVNLLLNAAEASEAGGTVRLETGEDSSGGFVQVRVVDGGKGIPKEHIDRVFEPFFTTKGTGKGTGLGLSVSLGIVRKHEGVIEIESEEGKGTRVTVLLPRAAGGEP